MNKIGNETRKIQQNITKLKAELKEKILALPDNPNIKRLSGNAFEVSSSQLFNNKKSNPTLIMSPEFFDFKDQYKTLCYKIDNTPIATLKSVLENIIEKKRLATGTKSGVHGTARNCGEYVYQFHPDVINHLKTTLVKYL